MSPVLLLSWRHFRQHPLQLLLAVIGIAAGSAMIIATELAIEGSQRAFDRAVSRLSGAATHQIVGTGGSLPETVYTRLRLGGWRNLAPIVELEAQVAGRPLTLLGVDPFAEGGFRPHLADTADAVSARLMTEPGTTLLSEAEARRLGLLPGDDLALDLGGHPERLRVIGRFGGIDAPDGLAIVDIATAQTLGQMAGRLSWIDVTLPPDDPGVYKTLETQLPPGARLLPAGARSRALEQMAVAFSTNLRAMSLLALLVAGFLVFNTMRLAVIQRRDRLALLRLLGTGRRSLQAAILIEALALGLAGTAAGVALGILLGQSLLGLVTRTMTDLYLAGLVTRFELAWDVVVRGAAPALLATLVAAWLPAREAARIPPAEALRPSDLERRARSGAWHAAWLAVAAAAAGAGVLILSGASLAGGFAGLFLLTLAVALATPGLAVAVTAALARLAAPFRSPVPSLAIAGVPAALSRTGVAIAALGIAVAVTVGVGLMIDSFRGSVAEWVDATLQADLYVSAPARGPYLSAPALDPTLRERVLALPQVSRYTTGHTRYLPTPDGMVEVSVLGLPPEVAPWHHLIEAVPDAWRRFRAGEGALVAEPHARRLGLHPGHRVEVPLWGGVQALPVLGIYRDYRGGLPRLVVSDQAGDGPARPAEGPSSLGLYLAPGADAEAVAASVRALAAEAGAAARVQATAELRQRSLEIFDQTFAVTQVLRTLAVLVAVTAVLGAVLALQLERVPILRFLRIVGMTPQEVFALVSLQSLLLGLLAGLIALPAGIGLAAALVHIINVRSFGWTMDLVVSAAAPAEGFLLAVTAAGLAGLYPAARAARTASHTAAGAT